MKILLIESDSAFAQELSTAIEARGLEARVTADGKEGVDLARVDRPDLIVLCVELPRMSGYSVCNKLKKDDQLKSIPLVIISAEATPETFEQHRKLKTRAEGYLIKPFDSAALLRTIEGLIELPPHPETTEVSEVTSEELVTLDDVELESVSTGSAQPASVYVAPPMAAPAAPPPATRPAVAAPIIGKPPPPPAPIAAKPPADDDDLKLLDEAFDSLTPEEPIPEGLGAPEAPPPASDFAASDAGPAHTEIDKLGDEADAALAALRAEEPPDVDLAGAAALLDGSSRPDGAISLGDERGPGPALEEGGARDTEIERLQARISDLLQEVSRANEALELRGNEVTEASARLRSLEADLEEHRAGTRRIEEQLRRAAEENARAGQASGERADAALRKAGEEARRAEERARALESETKIQKERADHEEQLRQAAEAAATSSVERARAAEERTRAAEENLQVAEGRVHAAEQRTHGAESRASAAESRASTAEARTSAAEARAVTAEQESASLKLRLEETEQAASLKAAEAEQARERAEALARELDAAQARTVAQESDTAALRVDLEAVRGELLAARTAAEGARVESERRLAEARKRIADLEAQNGKHEERVVKAYQKIKGDEKIRDKARKAIAIALQLLEERPSSAPPAEVQPRRE